MPPDHDKLRKTFLKNLTFLPEVLKNRILKVNEKDIWNKIEIVISEESTPICKYKSEGKLFHINSLKPSREAENWCRNLSISDAGALFVYGSGFGYPLLELQKQKQPNTLVMVFEQNIYLFIAMLYYFDLEPIFKTQKFSFFVGDIRDFTPEFQHVFHSEVFLYSTAPYVVFWPTAQRNFRKEYLEIHKHLFKELSLNIFYMGNDHYDTLLGFHNLIANVQEVIENPYLDILKDKYKNYPAFIIANGPSLDSGIKELEKIKGKGLIISTESAIVPLIKNNIVPDILCIVERTVDSYHYHFEDRNYPQDIALIGLAVIDKNIFPSFSGPKMAIFRSTESINVWMNNIVGNKGHKLDAGANVSHLAFELAAYLGANPIVLVAQNYAFGTNGITHSKDAVYLTDKGKKALNSIKAKPVVYVENNEGKQIPTTQLWLDFKHGLERKITRHSHLEVINTTEEGAKIEGTSLEKLSSVIEKYCTKNLKYRINDIIADKKKQINLPERKEKLEKLIIELAKYADKYRVLCQIAIKAKLRSKQMIKLAEQENLTDNNIEALNQAYEDNFNDLRKFMADNMYLVFLQQVLIVGFHKMNQLGVINSSERIIKVFRIYDGLFTNLNIVCQSVAINLEMAVENIRYHKK